MDQKTLNDYLKAGKIATQALQYGKELIKPGIKIVAILEKIEEKIISLGGGIAFPAQISLNEVAAHSCSDLNDQTELKNQVIKLDVGVHVNGLIGDNALSVDLSGKYENLIKASKEALNSALKIVGPEVALADIGKTIHEVITSYNYAPVKNLSGHGLEKFKIHTKPSIPNFDNGNQTKLKENQVIAIEPFASTGAGIVQESSPATIFTLVDEKPIRDPITRNVLKEIRNYQNLPFAKRWLEKRFGVPKTNFALRNLIRTGCLQEHPPLIDNNKGIISQAEHSIIVKDKPIVFT